MAKSQIGAVIGIEGAKQYINDLRNLAQYTKEWKSETDMLTSSFEKNFKSMQNVNDERAALQRQIDSMTRELEREQQEWDDYITNMNAFSNTDKQQVGMSELRTKINETQIELNNLNNRMKELPADNFINKVDLIKQNIQNSQTDLKKWGELFEDVGKKMSTFVTLPIVAGFTASTSAAVEWESSLNGVRKTTDMTESELDELATKLKDQALQTTYSSNELADLAQIAGQLGVRGVDDISKFVQVVSDLGLATDLSAEDAATSLAKIFNITEGGSLDNLEAIGDVIVHLGNNMATTEPEIVEMANRMASAGHTAGLTTTDIFALSAALSSVGITAEAGGSTVGQVLTKMQKEVSEWTATGEGNLEKIASISRMSAEEFAQVWKDEPVKAFEAFVTGLGNLGDESEDVVLILDELGMSGIRESNMLKALASAQEEGTDTTQLFTEALRLTKEAYEGVNEEGEAFSALENEASVRRNESATQFSNLKEAVVQLGQAIGEGILPIVTPVVRGLTSLISGLSKMSTSTKAFVLTVLSLIAAIGPALTLIGSGFQAFNALSVAAKTLNLTTGALALSIGKWVAIGAGVVVAIGAIVAAIIWLKEHSEQIAAVWEYTKEALAGTWEAIKLAFNEGCDLVTEKLNQFGEWIESLFTGLDDFITNGLNSLGTWFLTTTEGLISKLILKFVNFSVSIGNTISNIGSTIRNTFSNLVSNALSWGRDLIGNIISGITSRVGSLINSVKNIASTIWSYLHFSEPEKGALKDFNTWMPDMMKGISQGIYDNMYLVDNAASTLADHLGMGGTTNNYGGVVINLNVPSGANGAQIVDEIENELAQRTSRRRAVFA